MTFDDVIKFHGHACPGLALGFRVAGLALKEFGLRARDEELVAVVENNSCAVDSIQVMCGCTFGKGNLVFHDYGKQVYTFFKRPQAKALRIAIKWQPTPDDPETETMWKRYSEGDRSPDVTAVVQDRKARRMQGILAATDAELFEVKWLELELPEPARIYQSLSCSRCGEKVMEPRTREVEGRLLCIPCSENQKF